LRRFSPGPATDPCEGRIFVEGLTMQTDQHDDEDILRPRLVWSNPEEPRASPLVFIGVRDGIERTFPSMRSAYKFATGMQDEKEPTF
jgi:hypothetical protein